MSSDDHRPPSNPPPRAQPWADYALQVCVIVGAGWGLASGLLTEVGAIRIIAATLALQAVLRRRTGPGGGLFAFGASEAAGVFADGMGLGDSAGAV